MRFEKSNSVLFLFFLSSVVVIVISILASAMMFQSANMIEESSKNQMLALSRAASMLVTADELDAFMTSGDMAKPAYVELVRELEQFTEDAGIKYTYYMRLDVDTNKMQFVIDNTNSPQSGLALPQADREPGPDMALEGHYYPVPLGWYSVGFDNLLTAWAPVFYSDGSSSNLVAGVDMVDVFVTRARKNLRLLSVVLIAALLIVLGSAFLSLRLYMRKARQSDVANSAKSSFLSRMSHEMRTPMNAITGLCRMAQDEHDVAEIKGYISNIQASAVHLRHVIDDVLDISKIESGKMELEYAPIRLRDEIDALSRIIRPQADEKRLTFTVRIEPDVPACLKMDATHVRQVLVNLLSNAVKFTDGGGRVSLEIRALGTRGGICDVEWCVRDTGIGIDEATRGRLFTSFEQGDVSVTRKYGGTGLGLAISKQLVEMMGGAIRIESALGEGSAFIFNTPLALAGEAEVRENENDEDEAAPPDLRGRHILLVEDSEINQMIAVDILEKYGARVDTASNGREGLDAYIAAPEKYALIFMDVQMPVMDGYTCTREIRCSGAGTASDIPIVAMTANVFREDVEMAKNAGMNGHVGKPFETHEIERAIRRALAGREKQDLDGTE